jgi:carbamate kinase
MKRMIMARQDYDTEIPLVALGGNAFIQKEQRGTAEEQLGNLEVPMRHLAQLCEKYRLIITHGNGPQVGTLLLEQESCTESRGYY